MSLRAIGDADWPEIIAQTSSLMKLMLTSAVFAAEDATTRDQTLHAIEKLARQSSHSEVSVATILLALMNHPDHHGGVKSVAHHWLRGSGQPDLLQQLGLSGRMALAWQFVSRRIALPFYLCTLLASVFFIVWVLLRLESTLPGSAHFGWMTWCVALLAIFPASEAAVAVINRLISESARPQHLPRLALADGITHEHRVMVVIPCMLTSTASPPELVHRLQLHYLANPEPQAQFALLSDWADADTPSMASDDDLLNRATQLVRDLNLKYPPAATDLAQTTRFIVLHRQRHFSPTEQRWIGWERKRG
jgi:cyclic beta-1,2-glucan synthetase